MSESLEKRVREDVIDAVTAGEQLTRKRDVPLLPGWFDSKNAQLQMATQRLQDQHPIAFGMSRSLLWLGLSIYFFSKGYWNVGAPLAFLTALTAEQTRRRSQQKK